MLHFAFLRHRLVRITLGLTSVVAIVASGMGLWAVSQSRQVPAFYADALEQTDQAKRVARNQLQHDVQQLQHDASRRGHWRARFNEEQINAWLADQLPEKFSRWLARGARDPAIAISDGQILAAVRYTTERIDTVVSCEMAVAMTEEPNLLAIRLFNLKAGALPLPLEPFVRKISREAALGDLEIRWDFTPEGPIALVKIPHEDERYVFQPVVIESVDLVAGQLSLSGRTGKSATANYQPRGPVHQFVRYRMPTKRAATSRL